MAQFHNCGLLPLGEANGEGQGGPDFLHSQILEKVKEKAQKMRRLVSEQLRGIIVGEASATESDGAGGQKRGARPGPLGRM